MYRIAIIGFGVSGIFTLAHIPTERLSDVIVFESSCMAGDLCALYAGVTANITKSDILTFFRRIPRWSKNTFPLLDIYEDSECPKLGDVCKQMLACIRNDLRMIQLRIATVSSIQKIEDGWNIQTNIGSFQSARVILCIGGQGKMLDLPCPSIPLHIGLSKPALSHLVSSSDTVVVFGTSHSGTLVMKNLKENKVHSITGIYHGTKPFLFARDGESEGIKQDSAKIADEILAKSWGDLTPQLIPSSDFCAVFRKVASATYVVYAHGFETRPFLCLDISGNPLQLNHNPETATFEGYESSLFGFGMAFPSIYTSNHKTHKDIGFNGFITAISSALPAILE
jgi:hypothetical protein